MSHPTGWPQLGENRSFVQDTHQSTMQSEVTGWGDAPIDKANNNKLGTNGWGNPIASNSGWGSPTTETGWGGGRPQSGVDNGTSVWGSNSSSSRNQPVNNWTHSSHPQQQQQQQQPPPPPQSQSSGWNTQSTSEAPPPSSSSTPTTDSKISTNTSQPTSIEAQAPPSAPNPTPNSWAQAAAVGIPNTSKASESQSQTNGNNREKDNSTPKADSSTTQANEDSEDDPVQKLVNSHEGWGKRPIQQNKSWNVEPTHYVDPPHTNTGTEAWGKSGGWDDAGSQQQSWEKPAAQQNWGVPQQPQTRPSWSENNSRPGWNEPQSSNMSQMHNANPNPNNNNRWGAPPPSAPAPGPGSNWGVQSNPPPKPGGWNGPDANWDGGGGRSQVGNTGAGNWMNQQGSNNPPSNQWSQPKMPQNMAGPVDNGTSAWGNPEAYKAVNMWEKKEEAEKSGWGGNAQNNASSPTGWGEPTVNKPNMDNDNSTRGWGQNNSSKGGWNTGESGGSGWDTGNKSWGRNESNNQPWNQGGNGGNSWDQQPGGDLKDFGYGGGERKTSSGTGMSLGGNWGSGGGSGQFPNDNMKPMGMPRQGMPQNQSMVNQAAMMRGQAPPMIPPTQFHQLYQAVSKGLISPQMISPQLMTPHHVSLLQQVITKKLELQKLTLQMQVFNNNKNMSGNGRQQQEMMRMMQQQIHGQIQAHMRSINQNIMQSLGKSNMQMDMNPMMMNQGGGGGGMSSFNMNSLMNNLPNQRPINPSNSRESRLNSYKKPSLGMDGGMGMPLGLNDMEQSMPYNAGPYGMDGGMPSNPPTGLGDIGPPEFTPGVPWKGIRHIDPENDPDMTPGSVANAKAMSLNTVKDIDQVSSAQETSAQSYTKDVQHATTAPSSMMGGQHPATSISHELWRVPLNKQQLNYSQPSPQENWSGPGSKAVWVVLNNITNQTDISNLQALCSKQGSVTSFQPHCPVPGMALVQYSTPEEAANAQKSLDMKNIGSSMIVANVNTDAEIENLIAGSMSGKWRQNNFPHQPPQMPVANSFAPAASDMQRLWGANAGMAPPTSWSNGTPIRAPVWANDGDDSNRMLSSLLPDGLLGSETM